jgi:hypothetical protein
MPVAARRLIRKMRGGAQSHLLEAADGRFYIVKFLNNPQHRRVLINEWIAWTFLRYLQISTPDAAMVELTPEFIEQNPEVYIQLGSSRLAVVPGWHFGSCYPGDPARVAVYDFVPDTLLGQVANSPDFAGVLAFDKWVSNADARQAVFIRARLREYGPRYSDHPLRLGFIALMIDNGYAFNGPHWNFQDSPLQGLYFRSSVYEGIRGWDSFQPWLDRIIHFPENVVDEAVRQLPPQWVAGDEDALHALLERLLLRGKRTPELIQASTQGRVNPFPNWR